MSEFFSFIIERKDQIISLVIDHMILTITAIIFAILIGIPIGILIASVKQIRKPILGFINVIQAIPSMALLGLLIPILGIGSLPAVSMVVMYSLLPIVKNTFTALDNIDPNILESANGMGLTKYQTLFKIKLPISLPLIMSGVRISAVTAVGLMTLAAFIGAGGLGYLVFSGVQTVNNNMILAGAIPACILALIIDFIFSKIEVLVTPRGLNLNKKKSNPILLKVVGCILILSLSIGIFSSIFNTEEETIVIASKNYTEQLILGNLYADLLEAHTDLNIERKLNLGGSSVVMSAIKSDEIDFYVDYVGVILVNILNEPVIKNKELAYLKAKERFANEYDLELLEPCGFNNTYTLSMDKAFADKNGINTISDLANKSHNFIFSPTIEFENREDGLIGLEKTYGLKFKEVKAMDGSLRYSALANGSSQVIDSFSTEGLLKAFDLKVLEDDKNFFPPYDAVPVIRKDTLDKYPEIADVISMLTGKLTEDVMIELNYKVDKLNMSPEVVAKDYLVQEGLL